MSENERRPLTRGAARGSSTATDLVRVPRRYDRNAARRRAWARRQLDDLLGLSLTGEPGIDYHRTHLDLGVPEREYAGRELATAGWAP